MSALLPDADPLAAAWCAAVVASLVLPREAAASRPLALALAAVAAAAWALAAAVHVGRVPLPASWRDRARRPLSSRTLLLLGAAVGPVLLLFLLTCLRSIASAHRPPDRA